MCFLARDTSFERATALAFDQLRHFGADNPGIVIKLLEGLLDLALVVPEHLLPVVSEHVSAITSAARRATTDPHDLRRIEPHAARARQAMATRERAKDSTESGSDRFGSGNA